MIVRQDGFGLAPRWRIPAVALAAIVLASPTARAQSQSANPYYQNGLEAYAFPSVPNNLALPNQVRFSTQLPAGGTRYNRFEQFRDELNAIESNLDTSTSGSADPLRRTPRMGVPYYQSYRQYDRQMGRISSPSVRETEFFQKQQDRNARYFQALKEQDPVKRAQLLREIDRESQVAARNQAISPRRPTSSDSTAAPATEPATPPARMEPAATRSGRASEPSGSATRSGSGLRRPIVGGSATKPGATTGTGGAARPEAAAPRLSPLRSRRPATTSPGTGAVSPRTPSASPGAAAPSGRPLLPEEIREESNRAGRAPLVLPPPPR